jgi:TatD DNase family protein
MSMKITDAIFQNSGRLVDTHCHYNLSPIVEHWREHWNKAQSRGVVASWIPGTSVETSHSSWEIAQQDDNLWSLVGIHPGEVAENLSMDIDSAVDQLEKLIIADRKLATPKIIGIGEIGLDYFRLEEVTAKRVRAIQKHLCTSLLSLAKKYDLFVSLHVRDQKTPTEPQEGNAYWDMLELVRGAQLTTPFILHCSSGPLPYISQALEMGAYVSFAGNVTYPNAQALRDIWNLTPADHRFLETDVPFLPPQGFRGKTCEPWMIAETAAWIEANILSSSELIK